MGFIRQYSWCIYIWYLQASPTIQEFPGSCHRLPLSAWNLDTRGIYIYDDGFKFVVLFGMIVLPELAVNLLEKGFTTGFSKVCFSVCFRNALHPCVVVLEFNRSMQVKVVISNFLIFSVKRNILYAPGEYYCNSLVPS